jgi:hypothetical protein
LPRALARAARTWSAGASAHLRRCGLRQVVRLAAGSTLCEYSEYPLWRQVVQLAAGSGFGEIALMRNQVTRAVRRNAARRAAQCSARARYFLSLG